MPDTNNTTTQNDAEGVSSRALLGFVKILSPCKRGLPKERHHVDKSLRVGSELMEVQEDEIPLDQEIPKNIWENSQRALWENDYVTDGKRLFIAKYKRLENGKAVFGLHFFVKRFIPA